MTQNETPAMGVDQRGRADDSATTGGLMQQAVEQASGLIAAEVQLAKQELRETVRSGVVALVAGAAAVFGVIAFLGLTAVTRLRRIRPLRQTAETVKEDVAWAKQQLSRDAR